jgi:hypothetical protein
MKNLPVLLVFAISITFAVAQASASTVAPASASAKKVSDPSTQTKLFKTNPVPVSTPDSAAKSLAFQVNDVKGLLLTCIAPELNNNPDTDIFNSCRLAPGRTLDDVMHTFIQAIHFVQNGQRKDSAEQGKDPDEKSAARSAQN